MRELIGRALCFGLGFLFMAGAVPLFNFGEPGQQIWSVFQSYVAMLAEAIGVWQWVIMWLLGTFIIAGPLALVWLIAGRGVNRLLWILAGILGYGLWWMFGPKL